MQDGRVIDVGPADALLESYPEPIRQAADRLRAILSRTVPDVVERVRWGWRIIGYDVPVGNRSRYFAWIGPEAKHIHIGFQQGVLMADPDRRLEGAHLRLKKVRYLTFTSVDQIDDREVLVFVRDAVRIARLTRAERFGLLLERDPDPTAGA
jgi:hypothetical protein